MARSKSDLISRQELLVLIRDHAEAIKDSDPCQHAVLTYWQTVVEALPGKAVVDVVHCGECVSYVSPAETGNGIGFCGINQQNQYPCDFCSEGERRADHGTE